MNGVAIKQDFVRDDTVAHYLTAFKGQRAALPGSGIPWMQRLRDNAAASFTRQGFPSLHQEDWKYSDTRGLRKQSFELLAASARAATRGDIEPHLLGGLKSHRLVFVDGRFSADLSQLDELPAGAVVMPLSQALPLHVDTFQSHLGHYAGMDTNPFVAVNTMLMSDGVFVHLPRGAVIEAPIHVLYLSTVDGGTSQLRNLVIAESGAEATIIEHYACTAGSVYWTNAVTEIVLDENAGIEHYKLEEESDKAFHVASIEVHQRRDSRFTSHNAAMGGRFVRNDINTRLAGENAQCALNGLYVIKGRQHVDNHTRIDHVTPRTVSRELYKGVLDGWSRGVFNGKVIVNKYAQLTDSEQQNHNLLLSPNAEADPKPQLEIFANDVKCAHGATVGQLDADALYYLRSRGVPKSEARALLTFAFANEVITRMRIEPIRAHLENLIRMRLPIGVAELR
ncbi:MAG: Fe-S cluster assembly protein SufD [Gammaproteobacteria bacterium]